MSRPARAARPVHLLSRGANGTACGWPVRYRRLGPSADVTCAACLVSGEYRLRLALERLHTLLGDARQRLSEARTSLPSGAPTSEELADDPTAFDTCLLDVRVALDEVAQSLAAAEEVARG